MSQRHPPFWWLPLPPAAVQQNGGSCHLAWWARWALCLAGADLSPAELQLGAELEQSTSGALYTDTMCPDLTG